MRALLSEQIKINKITDHTTAATDAVTSGAVDMAGYEGVLFLTSFGTAAANNLVKAQQSSDDGATDAYSDLEGTSVTSGTSDEDVYIDIFRPTKRYLKLVATRGTSSTLESIYALQYNPRTLPVDNTITGTINGEAFVTPAEGTA
jgi:hypothetical protein